jgi:hypothetical protein
MGQDTRFWTEAFSDRQNAAIRKALQMFVDAHEQQTNTGSSRHTLAECHAAARAALDMRMT